jgi:hypothetical protein
LQKKAVFKMASLMASAHGVRRFFSRYCDEKPAEKTRKSASQTAGGQAVAGDHRAGVYSRQRPVPSASEILTGSATCRKDGNHAEFKVSKVAPLRTLDLIELSSKILRYRRLKNKSWTLIARRPDWRSDREGNRDRGALGAKPF